MLLFSEFFNVVYRHHEAAMIITILVLAVSGFILLTGSSDESKKPIVKAGGDTLDGRSYFRSRCHRIVVTTKNKTPLPEPSNPGGLTSLTEGKHHAKRST